MTVLGMTALPPGSVIGILGGGQLGRMLAMAAAKLGYRCHIFDPDVYAPAADVAASHICADYGDRDELVRFADSVQVVTYEFENVPVAAVEHLVARGVRVAPGAKALRVAQDRIAEKDFVRALGGTCGAYRAVSSLDEVQAALADIGMPAVLKTRRMGYDGKGQARIHAPEEAAAAWEAIAGQPAILEAFVAFECEVSVLIARGADGAMCSYGPILNSHKNGILDVSLFPADISAESHSASVALAEHIAVALDYVGVLAVELFLVKGEPWLNEIAPRVHNSGHGTLEGCVTSQFENHIRAICGLPLGSTAPLGLTHMRNLIGEDVASWPALFAQSDAHVHLYGKTQARAGRKMGHVTKVMPFGSKV
jgi:5-(carboxyamino)imidazole ribonucleotide synthase